MAEVLSAADLVRLRDLLPLLPESQREQVVQEVEQAWARRSPFDYARYVDRTYPDRPVLRVLSDWLVKAANGEVQKLMFFVPPRTAKSDLSVRKGVAWYKTCWPDRHVMIASYGADLAEQHSRAARDWIAGAPELGATLDPASRSVSKWRTAQGKGEVLAAGVGGPIVGFGANLAIIDDPIKAQDAMSASQREMIWDWYRSTLRNRLQYAPDGTPWAVVLIMTRWHDDDLAGRLIKEEGVYDAETNPTGWVVVRIPAFCDDPEHDPLGRQMGEPMQRIVDPTLEVARQEFEDQREQSGSYWFSALFQQSPQAADGALFKQGSFRYWSPQQGADGVEMLALDDGRWARASDVSIFVTVDLAASTKSRADWTVAAVWGVMRSAPVGVKGATVKPALVLLDRRRQRMEGPDHIKLLEEINDTWRPLYIGVDSSSFGLSLIQEAQRQGLPIRPLENDRDKVSRAIQAAVRIEAGDVFFPRLAPWLGEFENELLVFPMGAHDDQVDVLSYATAELMRSWGSVQVKGADEEGVVARWVRDHLARKGAKRTSPLGR